MHFFCEKDFNVNASYLDVEYEKTEALSFHEASFFRMDRRLSLVKCCFTL